MQLVYSGVTGQMGSGVDSWFAGGRESPVGRFGAMMMGFRLTTPVRLHGARREGEG